MLPNAAVITPPCNWQHGKNLLSYMHLLKHTATLVVFMIIVLWRLLLAGVIHLLMPNGAVRKASKARNDDSLDFNSFCRGILFFQRHSIPFTANGHPARPQRTFLVNTSEVR
jgi:hypothetical protein